MRDRRGDRAHANLRGERSGVQLTMMDVDHVLLRLLEARHG